MFNLSEEFIGNVKYASIGGLVGFFIIALLIGKFASVQAGIMIILFGIFACVVPISIYEYLQYNKYRKMEEHFPNFLEDFSEAKKSGMTFPQAFMSIAKTDYGSLSEEIKKASYHLSWSIPFPKVMNNLARRMKGSRLIHQAFTIINEAYSSGGNVVETMGTLAMNINNIKQIEDERRSIMSQQVFVLYFIFVLFIVILIGLYNVLIPMVDSTLQSSSSGGALGMGASAFKGAGILGKPVDYCSAVPFVCEFGKMLGFGEKGVYFKSLFILMSLMQGISSGIVAGLIGEGTLIAGVRHVGLMLIITMMSFMMFFG